MKFLNFFSLLAVVVSSFDRTITYTARVTGEVATQLTSIVVGVDLHEVVNSTDSPSSVYQLPTVLLTAIASRTTTVINELTSAGVTDMSTENIELTPLYDKNGTVLVGYQARNLIHFVIETDRSRDTLERIMGPEKANYIADINFQADPLDIQRAQTMVTVNATRNALATIDYMMEIIGEKRREVTEVVVDTLNQANPVPVPKRFYGDGMMMAMGSNANIVAPVLGGKNSVFAQVTVSARY
jgi:hypothetical protein